MFNLVETDFGFANTHLVGRAVLMFTKHCTFVI